MGQYGKLSLRFVWKRNADKERQKIIQRQIKDVKVIPTIIRYPFGIGMKDAKAKKVTVCGYNGQIDVFFTLPNNGRGEPIIIDTSPEVFYSDDKTFYSYTDNINYPLNDIAPAIFKIRFRDNPKRERRDPKKARELEKIGDRVTLSKAIKETGVKYSLLYRMVKAGKVEAEMIGGRYYIELEELKVKIFPQN